MHLISPVRDIGLSPAEIEEIKSSGLDSIIIVDSVVNTGKTIRPIFAQANPGGQGFGRGMGRGAGQMQRPGVFGTVSAINGNSLTVTGMKGFGTNASTGTTARPILEGGSLRRLRAPTCYGCSSGSV